MAELMAAMGGSLNTLKKGDIVEGTVKKITPQEILLEIGAKSDALVIEYDKKNLENLLSLLKVGDTVKASVISPESEEGFPVVSLRRMLDEMLYSRFEKAISTNQPLSVAVTDTTKGGYFVESETGVKGFLPSSQLLEGSLSVGTTIMVKVIEFDKAKKRVIFSQKSTKFETQVSELNKLVKEGQEVSGVVDHVASYGVFVTLEPKKGTFVEGFIHISEISYQRVENISELYKKGDAVTAQVMNLDPENRRVNLSVKKTVKDSFEDIKTKYAVDQKVKGTIKSIKSRGVTLQLDSETEGFIPAGKIPSTSTYKEGDVLDVEVTDFDMKRRLVVVSPVMTAKFIGYR